MDYIKEGAHESNSLANQFFQPLAAPKQVAFCTFGPIFSGETPKYQ